MNKKGEKISKTTKTRKMTEGNPLKLLLLFAIPILIGNLFQQLYNLADTIIVGQYVGTNGLAAVGAVSSISFFFISFCMGMSSGVGIFISQFFGAGEDDMVKKTLVNGVAVSFLVSLTMAILGFTLAEKCLELMDTPQEVIESSTIYMKAICVGIIGVAMYNTMAESLRALGDSKTPLMFLVLAAVTNIVLDLVLIIHFDMGVLGAGVATAVSQYIAAIGVTVFALNKNKYFRLQKSDLKIDKDLAKRCFQRGVPIACQFSLIAISLVAMQIVVNGFGELVIAVQTAASKFELMASLPFQTLTTSLQAYTGQNIGAGNNDRVKLGFKYGTIMIVVYCLILVPIVHLFGENIMAVFVSDREVIELGKTALKITSLFYVTLGMIYVTRGILNGVGDTKFAFLNGLAEVVGRFFFPKPLTMISSIGVKGIWIASGITWTITGLFGVFRFLKGNWKVGSKKEID